MSSPGIAPLGDRVVVRRVDAAKVSEGGLYIPDKAQEAPLEGVVLAVGPGRVLPSGELSRVRMEVGAKVLFPTYAGHKAMVDGDELLIMAEDEVLAVIGYEKAEADTPALCG